MSHPGLAPDLAAVLEVLDVHPTPPERPPDVPAPGPGPAQPGLFDPEEAPIPATTDPYSHLPPSRRWRAVPRHAGAPLSPTPSTRRNGR